MATELLKITTLVWALVCLAHSQALAEPPSSPAGVLLATEAGLYVRIDSTSVGTQVRSGNVYASQVNTGGVIRATTAVRSGGRVFLTGSPIAESGARQVHLTSAGMPPPDAGPAQRPQRLWALLTRALRL
jgi:hypothetical protein